MVTMTCCNKNYPTVRASMNHVCNKDIEMNINTIKDALWEVFNEDLALKHLPEFEKASIIMKFADKLTNITE